MIVAQELREQLGDANLTRFIADTFDPDSIVPALVHDLIVALPFRAIITTNYDNLLERAYTRVWNRQLKSITRMDVSKLAKGEIKGKFLLKLHGDIGNPPSIVLSHRDYVALIADRKYLRILTDLFHDNSILMIGYSLTDIDIQLVLDLLRFSGSSVQHFLLCKKNSRNAVEKRRLLEDRNVKVLEYVDYFGLHNHIETFLQGLLVEIGHREVLERVRLPIRRRIHVHYSIRRCRDGEFVWNYIFREGAITWSAEAQSNQLTSLKSSLKTGLRALDYLVFLVDYHTFDDRMMRRILSSSKKAAEASGVQIIFLVVGCSQRPMYLHKNYPSNPTFFFPEGFGEKDLEEFRRYVAQDMRGGFRQP